MHIPGPFVPGGPKGRQEHTPLAAHASCDGTVRSSRDSEDSAASCDVTVRPSRDSEDSAASCDVTARPSERIAAPVTSRCARHDSGKTWARHTRRDSEDSAGSCVSVSTCVCV